MAKWLESLDLGKHASKFEQHEIDPDVLPALTSEHLAAMGLNMEDRCVSDPGLLVGPISLVARAGHV
jgi:hypothetical protein|eukprot:COSAG01_NODE_7022_length_3388_cov_44.646688_2_plen_67_part_00